MASQKGRRNGMVIPGFGGPGDGGNNLSIGAARIGGKVPWRPETRSDHATGFEGREQVSVNHLIGQLGSSMMLTWVKP